MEGAVELFYAFAAGMLALTVAVAIILVVVSRRGKKIGKKTVTPRLVCNLLTAACVVIAAYSFISNMGWLRFVALYTTFSIIHPGLLFLLTNLGVNYFGKYKGLAVLGVFTHLTYLLANIITPDFGDIGDPYIFFGMVMSQEVVDKFANYFLPAYILNIVLIIVQLIVTASCRRKYKAEQMSAMQSAPQPVPIQTSPMPIAQKPGFVTAPILMVPDAPYVQPGFQSPPYNALQAEITPAPDTEAVLLPPENEQ
ncbi:MAG: hypothetical protein J6L81_06925 [Clostridia bacterium]|nr:hypothetical protein [Clostridia bacterium]